MSAGKVEAIFAQKMADNDPKMRDRAVKKLSKWLSTRTSFQEGEMMRIWKGLFYCFWMSDKMLVQEELAERISALIHVFSDNLESQRLFIHCGLVTLGREWVGIDQWRMNKFMLLTRRFLRQVFLAIKRRKWSDVQEMSKIFEDDVVCANDSFANSKTTVGFQLHFIDVFLEELAKVGGNKLPSGAILELLAPFIRGLQSGSDQRLHEHIVKRIFHHLMRQSDLGMAYEKKGHVPCRRDLNPLNQGETEQLTRDAVDDTNVQDSDSDDEVDRSKMDARAGQMDVVIPPLRIDYESLANNLFEAGSDKKVGKSHRKRLYSLSKNFRMLANGRYPLAMDLSDDKEEYRPKKLKMRPKQKRERKAPDNTTLNGSEGKSKRKRNAQDLQAKTELIGSETKKRKLNFALSNNGYQSLNDYSQTISESPEIPYKPSKNPKKGVLKNKSDISVVSTPSPKLGLQRTVQKNTIINAQSQALKAMGRMLASDFF